MPIEATREDNYYSSGLLDDVQTFSLLNWYVQRLFFVVQANFSAVHGATVLSRSIMGFYGFLHLSWMTHFTSDMESKWHGSGGQFLEGRSFPLWLVSCCFVKLTRRSLQETITCDPPKREGNGKSSTQMYFGRGYIGISYWIHVSYTFLHLPLKNKPSM